MDRILIHDAFWEDTLALWRNQRLGENDPCDFFEMDFDAMYFDLSGRAEQKVLAEDGQNITVQDRAGYVVRKFVGLSRSMDFLLMDIAIDSEWVREMCQVHVELLVKCLKHCIALGAKPDGLFLADDVGCTRGMLFSPAMWRDIFKPLYAQLASFLHGEDISLWLHSCGDVRGILPDLIDVGLAARNPIQSAS